jgi:hypothetical protein
MATHINLLGSLDERCPRVLWISITTKYAALMLLRLGFLP